MNRIRGIKPVVSVSAIFCLLSWGLLWARDFPTGSPRPQGMAVADFNNDGVPDLIVSDGESPVLAVLFGDGSGGLSAPVAFKARVAAEAPAVGDFNADGYADVVVRSREDNRLYLLLNDGQGGLREPMPIALDSPPVYGAPVVADLDGDQHPDILARVSASELAAFLGDGQGHFQPRAIPMNYLRCPTGADVCRIAFSAPLVADLNHDGLADIVLLQTEFWAFIEPMVSGSGSWALILLNQGDGSFAQSTIRFDTPGTGINPVSVYAGDIDNDGNTDLILQVSQGVSLLFGDGTGGFPILRRTGFQAPVGSFAVDDFNQDGYLDIAALSTRIEGGYQIGLGDGTSQLRIHSVSSPRYVQVIAADVDGDGYPDLLLLDVARGVVTVRWGDDAGEVRQTRFP